MLYNKREISIYDIASATGFGIDEILKIKEDIEERRLASKRLKVTTKKTTDEVGLMIDI